VEKCNDNKKQPDLMERPVCLPCSELNKFRALDDGTFIGLLIQSDRTLSGSRPLSAPFRKVKGSLVASKRVTKQTSTITVNKAPITATDCCNYPLMCSLSNLSADEVSADTSNLEYESDSQYVYNSDNNHEMTRLDCGHPF